jgi:predicted glycosyltransferase
LTIFNNVNEKCEIECNPDYIFSAGARISRTYRKLNQMKLFMNILIYSHDIYGNANIKKNINIASKLILENHNIIIISDSLFINKIPLLDKIDFITIPKIHIRNKKIEPKYLKICTRNVISIRREIIYCTVKNFKPSIFLVNKPSNHIFQEIESSIDLVSSYKNNVIYI